MINGKELLNFCKTHGYYVEVVRLTDCNGCKVKYPPRTAIHPTSLRRPHMAWSAGLHTNSPRNRKRTVGEA